MNPEPQKIAITGVGLDQSGIVAGLTKVLFERGANIEDTSMTLLNNQFAMIVIAILPPDLSLEDLRRDFSGIESALGLSIFIQAIPLENSHVHPAGKNITPVMISVAGADRTGITYHVSQLLAEYQVNITDLNAQIIPGETEPVYIMLVETEVSESTDQVRLKEALQELGHRLKVEIQYRILEPIAM